MKWASIQAEMDVAQAKSSKGGEMEMKVFEDIAIAGREVERQKFAFDAQVRKQGNARKNEAERLADAQP